MKKARFPRAFFISIIPSNPLHPLSGGLPEPAALRLQNPGGFGAAAVLGAATEVREAVQKLAGLPQKRPILMEAVPKKAGLPHFRGSTQHGNSFEMCRRGRVAGS